MNLFLDTPVLCLFVHFLVFPLKFFTSLFTFSFSLSLFLPLPLSCSLSLSHYFKEALMWAREKHISNLFLSRWWNMPTGDTRLLQQNNLERRWRITFPAVTFYDDGLAKIVYWSWCLRQTIYMQSHLYFNIIVQGREDFNLQVCFGKFFFQVPPTPLWLMVKKVNLLFHLKVSASGSKFNFFHWTFYTYKMVKCFLAENKLCLSWRAWFFQYM